MPTGNPQSTLLSELNRLANGGTYPPVNTMDEAAAARAWAGRTDIPLTTTDTVGVLNEIAGLPSDQWLDYSGVCNYLAGTTNLPAAAALRQIEGDVQSNTPSEPLLLFATPGNQSVFLNWAPPANEGDAPVDSYRVILAGQPGTVYQEGPGIGATITGLTNGTAYSFQVQAHNSFGWGPLSLPSAGVVPAFEEYAAVQSGNTISFTSWREANAQPNNGYPGRYFYSDGTQLFQGQTAVVQGSSVPVAAAWGNSNLTVQPDGWYSPDTLSIPDMQSNTGFNYATSVNIVPNYSCPMGGFYDPITGMCVESPVYSWTVPFFNNPWYVGSPGTFAYIDLYGLNARSQSGWPQVDTVVTFTISGITGPYAALNGVHITGIAGQYSIDGPSGLGSEFETVYFGLGLPSYIGSPETFFPGFTLNWQ